MREQLPARLFRFGFGVLAIVASGTPEAARAGEVGTDYDGGVVVAYRRLSVDSHGKATETVEGDGVVTLRDGTEFVVDTDHLEDPDGNRYYIVGDASQESEDAPTVYETRTILYVPEVMTTEEIESEYAAIKKEAGTLEDGDLEKFRERRSQSNSLPERTVPQVQARLQEGLDAASDDELIDVNVLLVEQPSDRLPSTHHEIADEDPAVYLDQVENRVLAIENRKTATRASQAELVASLEDAGGKVIDQHWLVNVLRAEIPAGEVKRLATDARVARIELRASLVPAGNQMEDIRQATQLEDQTEWSFGMCSPCSDFLKNTGFQYNGSRASGFSDADGILVGLLDTRIDITHPVLEDRLYGAWVRNDTTYDWDVDTTGMGTLYDNHGMTVASMLLGNLEGGSDLNIAYDYWEGASGASPGSYLVALPVTGVGSGSGDLESALEFAVELPSSAGKVDIINASVGYEYDLCDLDDTSNEWIDAAMKENIFVVVAAGNENVGSTDTCNITLPATASGAFAVAADSIEDADLQTADIRDYSSHGPDVVGRPVVAMTAPDGREPGDASEEYQSFDACYDNEYCDVSYDGGWGTSFSAPVVAGAAADYKDFMIDVFGTSAANDVGNLYAQMRLMGDLQRDGTPSNTNLDPVWGAGRLRMRLFDSAGQGMDSPWRMRYAVWELDDAEVVHFLFHPGAGGGNQALPNPVDQFRTAVWWHEPNLETGTTPATVAITATDGTLTYSDTSMAPGAQRAFLKRTGGAYGYPLGGNGGVWNLKIEGLDIPASVESDYYHAQQKRKVYGAVYWEDRNRDDTNGPNSTIQ